MKISKTSHVTSVKKEANKWSPQDDFTLMILTGTHTYQEIALRLGRSKEAVQRRASRMGLKPLEEAAQDAEIAEIAKKRAEKALLEASEEDLSEFLVECEEEPAKPLTGGRTYHREYKRSRK